MTRRRTREECIQRAGEVLAVGRAAEASMTPREVAERAWTPTSPYTVNELEDIIRVDRGMTARHLAGGELDELLTYDERLRAWRASSGIPYPRRSRRGEGSREGQHHDGS